MRAIEVLQGLGSTSDEVANTLRAKGIKGRYGSACDCPVANYLKAAGFPYPSVGVSTFSIDTESGDIPLPVKLFIFDFDILNNYEDLSEE